jgi:DUF4097 and DUF4098 domain-containing protein YvlB
MVQSPTLTGPRRRIVVVAGLLLAVFTIIGVGSWLFSVLASRTDTVRTSASAQTTRIRIDAGSGDVTVTASDDGTVSVQRRATYSMGRPELTEKLDGGTLALGARCSGPSLINRCYVSYSLRVPATVAVDVTTTSGDVVVRDVKAGLVVTTDSGDVTAGALAGDAQVKGGSGDVRLDFAAAPKAVSASTGSGDLRIGVPDGTPYEVKVTGEDQQLAVPSTAGAPHVIQARSSNGVIAVSYLTP